LILVNTSVWVDDLRKSNATLAGLLEAGMVLGHPFVIGELAVGNLRQGARILSALSDLPRATVATDGEVLDFIVRQALAGRGIEYVDANLLAAVRLSDDATLWTLDKRLNTTWAPRRRLRSGRSRAAPRASIIMRP
jgi:predicted nucleic acid-binding protein